MKKGWERIRDAFGRMALVDRVLMLFMAVLLVSMAVQMLDEAAPSEEAVSINTVIRTSASAIFGYFISGNFLRSGAPSQPAQPPEPSGETPPASVPCCSRLQVMTVATVGLVALFLLLIARNRIAMTPESAATVSQLRDFMAACIGYLVSCGKKQ